jgi:hypothetical protein|tara:strand:- start:293 stop:694 length:402 start_codon:yes stop_codon:yes gene_type:complete
MNKYTVENKEVKTDKLDSVLNDMKTNVLNYETYQKIIHKIGNSKITLNIWEDGTVWVSHSDLGAKEKGEKVRTVESKLSGSGDYSIDCNVHGVEGKLDISDMRKRTENYSNFRLLNIGSKENKFENIVSIFGK